MATGHRCTHIYEGGREPECERPRCLFELSVSVGVGRGFMYPKCILHSNVNVTQKLIRPIVILTQIYERATYEVAVSKFAIRSLHLTSLSVVEFMLV